MEAWPRSLPGLRGWRACKAGCGTRIGRSKRSVGRSGASVRVSKLTGFKNRMQLFTSKRWITFGGNPSLVFSYVQGVRGVDALRTGDAGAGGIGTDRWGGRGPRPQRRKCSKKSRGSQGRGPGAVRPPAGDRDPVTGGTHRPLLPDLSYLVWHPRSSLIISTPLSPSCRLRHSFSDGALHSIISP